MIGPSFKPLAIALILAAGIDALAGVARSADSSLPLALVSDVPLTGGPTRLDYESLDQIRHLLFIAHLGDGNVIVFDTKAQRVVATVPGVARAHGVLAVPALGIAYASATGSNEVVAIDESTFKIVARMDGGVYPDGIAYDPVTGHLFVSDEHGQTETVIDTHTNRRIATIPLGGDVGNSQYDAFSHHVFVNVQTQGVLVEIDPATNAIVSKTQLPGCSGNHGLFIDAPQRRAYIACQDNATLALLDMHTMRVTQTWPIGADPDVLSLDPQEQRLYIAAESGVMAILSNAEAPAPIARGFLAPAAHSVVVDPDTHLIYVPLEAVDGKPVLRIYRFGRG
jgi:YVTN family beta-propeller protein